MEKRCSCGGTRILIICWAAIHRGEFWLLTSPPLFPLVPGARRDPESSMVSSFKGLKAFPVCSLLVSKQSRWQGLHGPSPSWAASSLASSVPATPHSDTNNVLPQAQTKGKKELQEAKPIFGVQDPVHASVPSLGAVFVHRPGSSSSPAVFLGHFSTVTVPGGLALGSWLLILIRGMGTVAGAGQVLCAPEAKEKHSSPFRRIPQPTA